MRAAKQEITHGGRLIIVCIWLESEKKYKKKYLQASLKLYADFNTFMVISLHSVHLTDLDNKPVIINFFTSQ